MTILDFAVTIKIQEFKLLIKKKTFMLTIKMYKISIYQYQFQILDEQNNEP